jgi:hypothetical protein
VKTREPVAVSGDGGTVAIGDGPELLVYDGLGQPRWKQFLEDAIQQIAVASDRAVILYADGRIAQWRLHMAQMDPLEIPGATHVVSSSDGVVAVATARGIALLDPRGGQLGVPVDQPVALSFGADGSTLAVVQSNGLFSALALPAGGALGSVSLSGPPSRVAWVGAGAWVVCHGPSVSVISADGSTILHTFSEAGPIGPVAAALDGVAAAAVVDGSTVVVYDAAGFRCAGRFAISRPVGDLAFAPNSRLVIALDDGDMTFVDLFSGTITRSEPHPGRGRNNWGVRAEYDPGIVRGSAVKNRAGKKAIARYVGPSYDPSYERRKWQSCLLVLALTAFTIASCSGMALVVWILHLMRYLP